jgi:putative hydrolase of the HAD superfamily
MKTPKMILFDCGNTLLCEPGLDFLRGYEALMRYAVKNPQNLTPEQIKEFSTGLFQQKQTVRDLGFEIHGWQFNRFVYEYLGIEFSVSIPEAEKILWDNVSTGALMPNVENMLDYINAKGIRSGVISNIGWSGAALTERINQLLPRNRFEFIIASSDYMFRKPRPLLFELALKKAGLDAEDVWYCGDSVVNDVEGSAAVGIFPVWYEDKTKDNPWREQEKGIVPTCEHLHIHDWDELIRVLGGLSDNVKTDCP